MRIQISCTNCGKDTFVTNVDDEELPEVVACPCCGHDVTEETEIVDDE